MRSLLNQWPVAIALAVIIPALRRKFGWLLGRPRELDVRGASEALVERASLSRLQRGIATEELR